jgi:hypothetical protein
MNERHPIDLRYLRFARAHELALANQAGDKLEAAYRRGDLFEKRMVLMDDWAAFLARPAAEVVKLRRS